MIIMKDIVLINPPVSNWGRMKDIRQTSPPLGLLYLASFLEKSGYKVQVLDLALEPERLSSSLFLENSKPRIVGLTSTTYNFDSALRIAEIIKKYHRDTFIVFGGAHPTIRPYDALEKDFVDCVVMGEGEITFNSLCAALLNDKEWRENSGIAFMDNEKIKINPPQEFIKDLDSLPFPARHLVPLEKYRATPINYKRWPSTPVITSRGCPFKCTFCSNPVHGRIPRLHSPEYIVRELIFLKSEYGIKDVSFWDDTFTINKRRTRKLCALIDKEGLDLTWSCATRVDAVDLEILKIMKEAGCWLISFGVESGVDRLRKKVNKGISEEQILEAFEACRKIGIETRAFFMLGIPTETKEESQKTIEFAKRLNPDFAQFTLTTPYPGCELFKEAVSQGWSPPKWEHFQSYSEDGPVYVPEGRSGKELMCAQTKAFKSFYLRPSYILNRFRKIKSYEELKKHIVVFFAFFRW